MRAVVIAIDYFHSPLILVFHRLSQLHHRGGGVGLVGLFLALAALSKESHFVVVVQNVEDAGCGM